MKKILILLALSSVVLSMNAKADTVVNFSEFGNPNQFLDRGTSLVDINTNTEWLNVGATFGVTPCEYEASLVDAAVGDNYTCVNAGNVDVTLGHSLRNLVIQDWRLSSLDSVHGFFANLFNAVIPASTSSNLVSDSIAGVTQDQVNAARDVFSPLTYLGGSIGTIYGISNTFTDTGRLIGAGVGYSFTRNSGFLSTPSIALATPYSNIGLWLSRTYDPDRLVFENAAGSALTAPELFVFENQYNSSNNVASVSAVPPTAILMLFLGWFATMVNNRKVRKL
jgi:hypothetical protein